MGRKAIGTKPMTPLERLHKHRAKKREEAAAEWERLYPDGLWHGIELVDLDEIVGRLLELETGRK